MGSRTERLKSIAREAVDVPERLAIVAGSSLIVLSIFSPVLLPTGLLLAGGGYISLKVTDVVFPKKRKTA